MNKFREETQALNTHKRKAIFYSDSYEGMIENGYDLIAATCEEIGIKDTLISYNLTQRELTYCELIMKNYSNAEISEILEVSIMTLSNMRKKLRQKLSPLALGF
jgi:ATP/maltotriose-dependent transcriptional regulator MalT